MKNKPKSSWNTINIDSYVIISQGGKKYKAYFPYIIGVKNDSRFFFTNESF